MKGSMENEDDVKKASEDKGGGRAFIKIEKKTFIRLHSKDFNSEYSHIFKLDSGWVNIICLGGTEGKGYSPEKCPICAKSKKHWDQIKKLKANKKFKKSTKLQAEAEIIKKKGKALQASKSVVVLAMAGEAVKEKRKGKVRLTPEWDGEIKFLSLTGPQWTKLTDTIFEDHDFMNDSDDLINRNFMFKRENKSGKKGRGKYTEVIIVPSKKETEAPDAENDPPDLDDAFVYREKSEVISLLNEFLEENDEDPEEDEVEGLDTDDDDDEISDDDDSDDDSDDDEDEDDSKKKGKKKKGKKKDKKKKSSKKKKKDDDEDDDESSDDDDEDEDDDPF